MKYDITYKNNGIIQGRVRGYNIDFVTDDLEKVERYKEIFDYFRGNCVTVMLNNEDPVIMLEAPEDLYFEETTWSTVKENMSRVEKECVPGARAFDEQYCIKNNVFYPYASGPLLEEIKRVDDEIFSFGKPIAGRVLPGSTIEVVYKDFAIHGGDNTVYIYRQEGFERSIEFIKSVDIARKFFGHFITKIREMNQPNIPLPVVISYDSCGFDVSPKLIDAGKEYPGLFEEKRMVWIDFTCTLYDAKTGERIGKVFLDEYGRPQLEE